jgi:hypothetical protein
MIELIDEAFDIFRFNEDRLLLFDSWLVFG